MRLTLVCLLAALTALPALAQEPTLLPDSVAVEPAPPPPGPYFVMAGSFKSKQTAQTYALQTGGWVLRTDLYALLTPGFYAVVHGPFFSRDAAEATRERLGLTDAYVRLGGDSYLPPSLGDPALLAALLGDLGATVDARDGATDGCAPPEPYLDVQIRYAIGEDTPPAFGRGFWVIRRTGEVRRIPACATELAPAE
ncbi:MAG: SPOR domain-containing protein [Bacteroidota bacterium]